MSCGITQLKPVNKWMRFKHFFTGHPRSDLHTVRVVYPRTSHLGYTTTLDWDYKTQCHCGKILTMTDVIKEPKNT